MYKIGRDSEKQTEIYTFLSNGSRKKKKKYFRGSAVIKGYKIIELVLTV